MANAGVGRDRLSRGSGAGHRSALAARLALGLAMPVLWALGWTVTSSIGVDVERQYVVFGSAGAITVMALSGLLFEWLCGGERLPVRARPGGPMTHVVFGTDAHGPLVPARALAVTYDGSGSHDASTM